MLAWVKATWARATDSGYTSAHPLHLVKQKIKDIPSNDKELVVLLSTGSYCPVHKEHLRIFDVVKSELEKEGKCVIGGFMCPSHDDYVSYKMKKAGSLHIPGFHRWKLIEMALSDSDWIVADPFEVARVRIT